MPIKIPQSLPAHDVLTNEGVMVMSEEHASRQDIRPLQIGLLNLMPKKVQTETQFARLIGATPLQIELTLLRMSEHESKHTAPEHMEAFYKTFAEAKDQKFDGLIITGAPIEHLEFNDVSYIDELGEIFDWTQTNVHSTFGVCWGGMAMINHFHGVKKHMLDAKAFGCFRHKNLSPASPGLVADPDHRALYIFNHLEYDSGTLKEEYDRDVSEGTPINVPTNYYPNDDPLKNPENRWRSHGHLLYGNWLNEIYQTTPFDMNDIGTPNR